MDFGILGITKFTFVWAFANLIREMGIQKLDSMHQENTRGKLVYGAITGFSLLLSFIANYEIIF